MPEVLTQLQQRVLTFWKELDKSQKIRIYIIAGIIVAAIFAGFIVMSKVTYEPLFIDGIKSQSDLTEVKSALTAAKIKYKDLNGNISVDSKSINQAQQVLIDKGLPKNPD